MSTQQFHHNTVSLLQQGEIYRDLKTMNTSSMSSAKKVDCDAPLEKKKRRS